MVSKQLIFEDMNSRLLNKGENANAVRPTTTAVGIVKLGFSILVISLKNMKWLIIRY